MHTKKTNNTKKLIQISYHSVLTKIQKLQNFKKKEKKNLFLYRPVLPEIGRYGRYEAGPAGIFSDTKQGGRVYRIAGRYGILRPYQPVRYGIDNLVWNSWMKECAPYITHAPKDGGGVCHNNAYLGITNNYNMFGPILDSPIIFRKDKGSLSH